MNFADQVMKENKERETYKEYTKWAKPLTPDDISRAMMIASKQHMDEMPELLLVGMLFNMTVLDTLFPKDEFDKLMKEKGGEEKWQ